MEWIQAASARSEKPIKSDFGEVPDPNAPILLQRLLIGFEPFFKTHFSLVRCSQEFDLSLREYDRAFCGVPQTQLALSYSRLAADPCKKPLSIPQKGHMASRVSQGLNKYSVHAETRSPNKPLLQAGVNDSRSGGRFCTIFFLGLLLIFSLF